MTAQDTSFNKLTDIPAEPVRYFSIPGIFLAASLEGLNSMPLKDLRCPRMLYISTPANPERDAGKESWSVIQTRIWLAKQASKGLVQYAEYDIAGKSKDEIAAAAGSVACVLVSNGKHPAYFKKMSDETGFGDIVKDGVESGRIMYAGLSTGAGFAGKSIGHLVSVGQDSADYQITSTEGFGILPVVAYPHWGSEKFMNMTNASGVNYEQLWAADHAAGWPTLRLAD